MGPPLGRRAEDRAAGADSIPNRSNGFRLDSAAPLPGGAGADARAAPSLRAANLTEETGLQPGGREQDTGGPGSSGHREARPSAGTTDRNRPSLGTTT
eukprot:2558920-Pyramimonas_sp.AAC.1